MTTVGIHQPNYLPWLGYFYKISRSDVFVFLDDVQFSKNGYCNRVQILQNGKPRWLSVPVSYKFGEAIDQITLAQPDWPRRHLDTFQTNYGNSRHFKSVWTSLRDIYHALPTGGLAQTNRFLVEAITEQLGLSCQFAASSNLDSKDYTGDDRLVQIAKQIAQGGSYISGCGAANYQDKAKFYGAGLSLIYSEFQSSDYYQGGGPFVPGLSVVDAAFHLGWEETARLLTGKPKAGFKS